MNTQHGAQDGVDPESEIRELTKTEAEALDRGRLSDKLQKILGDADMRDDQANTRDDLAEERATAADRRDFTNADGAYPGHRERRAAALDRADSKTDRESSAGDRTRLTEDDANTQALTTTEIQVLKEKITDLENASDEPTSEK